MRGALLASAIAFALAFGESRAHAIQGGAPDVTHSYAVGVLGDGTKHCSGVLVTPNLVLTARQCVQPTSGVVDCAMNPTFTGAMRSMQVTTDATFASAAWRSVKTVVLPATTAVCGNDLALLVLDDLVTGVTPIAPAVNEPPNHPKYTFELTAIGYGDTSPATGTSGTRRIREQISIACVPGDASFPCAAGFDAGEFAAGDGLCTADQGLAALEQTSFTSGAPVSLGVLSRTGVAVNGTDCEGSIFTRLDLHRDLIVATAESASNNWVLYAQPTWTIPPPPPDAGPDEPDAGGDAGGGTTTTPSPGGGRTTSDAGATEDPAAAPSSDDGGCTTAGKNGPFGAVLLVGAVALALVRRRRNGA